MSLRILSAADVVEALPMAACIEGMKEAFAQLSAQEVDMPLRSRVSLPRVDGVAIFMPAYMKGSDDLAIKIVSFFPENPAQGLPAIHAAVMVLNAATGQPVALLEGGSLTAIRTGAGAGAATDLLARNDATEVAIIGSGVQARTQLEAVCTVRPVTTVRVYSPNLANAEAFASDMAGHGPIPDIITVTDAAGAAVRGADIICAATSSAGPVFDAADLKPGVHINGVGSFTPEMQEVDVATVAEALVVVDSLDAAQEEAGDLIVPIEAGVFGWDHVHAELGEIVLGRKAGRTSPVQRTYFKSVGVGVQDVVAARIALSTALARNLGTELAF